MLHKILPEENLSPNEISVLIVLSNNESISTSSQLALILDVSKGLVSRSVESLYKKGYLELVPGVDDKRCIHISLSKSSTSIIQKINKEMAAIHQSLLMDITQDEMDQMKNTLEKILSRFIEKE